METTLPKVYDQYVSAAIRAIKHGRASKSDFDKIDAQASELSNDQKYEFFRRIKDGLTESLTEHAKICQDPANCSESLGSEKGINSMNWRMTDLEPLIDIQRFKPEEPETANHPPDHTTARQVLAMKFLLEYAKIEVANDKAAERFLHFLTGKSKENLYKLWRNPYNKDLLSDEIDDLRFIRKFFEDLGVKEIVKAINNQIDKP